MELFTKCCDSKDFDAVIELVEVIRFEKGIGVSDTLRLCIGYKCKSCGKIMDNIIAKDQMRID